MTIAHTILSGEFKPWQLDSRIATPDDWRFAAQCAVDGDDRDLLLYFGQLAGDIEIPDEPPKWADCVAAVERWKSQTKEPAVEAAASAIKEAA